MNTGSNRPTGAAPRLRRNARRLLAVALITVTYAFSRLPHPTAAQREAQAGSFRFERQAIRVPPRHAFREIRAVHPSFKRIAAWVSSVGAAVALNDLDADGLPNDTCLVDPRTDDVIISPVGEGRGYEPVALELQPWFDARTMAPMGCLPGDFNEDGRTDVLVYFWGRTPVLFLRRDGAIGNGAYVSAPLVDPNEAWYTNAVTRADLDGDGHADIIAANYFPDGAAILDASASGVESMPASMSRADNGGKAHVFLWAGRTPGDQAGIAFRRVEHALPEPSGRWTLGLAAADLDGDLLPELYFANDFGPDSLLHNESTPGQLRFRPLRGRRSLTTAGSKVLGRDSFKGMGVDFGDVNRDGIPDIFVSNIASQFALEESHFLFASTSEKGLMKAGIAPYVDRSEGLGLSRSGWAWDAKLDDFNNDGTLETLQATGFVRGSVSRWPELHELAMGNDQLLHNPRMWPRFEAGTDLSGRDHNPFFVRHTDGRYYDLAREVGLGDASVSRGIAIADVDGDGRLDFAVANQWAPSTFYFNHAPNPGSFVGLRLLRSPDDRQPFAVLAGRPANIAPAFSAIGAVARVRPGSGLPMVREVDGGNGHSGKRSADLHFGLGRTDGAPVEVELRWRDAAGQPRVRVITVTPGWHTVLLGR